MLARGSQSTTTQGPARRFLTDYRMLIVHVLKKSAGIGHNGVTTSVKLEENVEDLAETFMVLITTTGFLEVSHNMRSCPSPSPNHNDPFHCQTT